RRVAGTGLAGHGDPALPVGALVDDEDLRLDGALHATGRADLESATAVHGTLVIAVDDHVVGLDRAAHAGLRADAQRSLALDLALCLALDPQIAVADVLAVDPGMRVDDRLVATVRSAGEFAG